MEIRKKNYISTTGAVLGVGLAGLILMSSSALASDDKEIVIMHTGDLHGDLKSHTNDREDANGRLEGGLARVATIVKEMRAKYGDKLVWGHTGDTTSGSAIATYTQGQALIEVWDALGPDVFATGNWEYAYGIYRYLQFFGTNDDIVSVAGVDPKTMAIPPYDTSGTVFAGPTPTRAFKTDQNGESRRWGTIAANAYFNGENAGPGVVNKGAGELLTDPYLVKTVNGVRVGFIGCTTNRGPQVVSSKITKGVTFSNCMGTVKFPQNKPIAWPAGHPNRDAGAEKSVPNGTQEMPQWGSTVGFKTVPEIVKFTHILRLPQGTDSPYINSATGAPWKGEGVDLVVLMSEAGIPESIWNAEHTIMPEGIAFPEIVLSSDTHEETAVPVAVTTPAGDKTILIEEGEDGAQVGILKLKFKNGKLAKWKWKGYTIDDKIAEDKEIADLIEIAEAPFYSGPDFDANRWSNPYNGYKLTVPLDHLVAATEVVLERNRFSHEHDPDNLKMPAVIEGTLHDVYVDAFRALTGADVGGIRGFRYTNTIMPGPITVDDIYHSLSIGAMIAVGSIPATPEAEHGKDPADETGNCIFAGHSDASQANKHNINKCHNMAWPRNLVQEIELSGNSTQQTNIPAWGGGWFWNYSGIEMDLDAYQGNFDKYGKKLRSRVSNLRLVDTAGNDLGPLESKTNVSYASYYYDADYNRINRNQVVPPGKCGGSLSRACVGDKVKVLAKTGTAYGAPMVMVTPAQFAAKSVTIGADTYEIHPMDVVEAVGRYIGEADIEVKDLSSGAVVANIRQGLGGAVTDANFRPTFPRIHLTRQLPNGHDEFGFGVIQPFRGALEPAAQTLFADKPDDSGKF